MQRNGGAVSGGVEQGARGVQEDMPDSHWETGDLGGAATRWRKQ